MRFFNHKNKILSVSIVFNYLKILCTIINIFLKFSFLRESYYMKYYILLIFLSINSFLYVGPYVNNANKCVCGIHKLLKYSPKTIGTGVPPGFGSGVSLEPGTRTGIVSVLCSLNLARLWQYFESKNVVNDAVSKEVFNFICMQLAFELHNPSEWLQHIEGFFQGKKIYGLSNEDEIILPEKMSELLKKNKSNYKEMVVFPDSLDERVIPPGIRVNDVLPFLYQGKRPAEVYDMVKEFVFAGRARLHLPDGNVFYAYNELSEEYLNLKQSFQDICCKDTNPQTKSLGTSLLLSLGENSIIFKRTEDPLVFSIYDQSTSLNYAYMSLVDNGSIAYLIQHKK